MIPSITAGSARVQTTAGRFLYPFGPDQQEYPLGTASDPHYVLPEAIHDATHSPPTCTRTRNCP